MSHSPGRPDDAACADPSTRAGRARRRLNLGVVAHVDAGKTSLTERLLLHAGAIDRAGSVDEGDTRTDRDAIERRRGITIDAAVVSLRLGPPGRDTQVNLVDTPGHAEFVGEVERALRVLDAALLVISASHGVQPRTRVLLRTLRRLRLPTMIAINKIDLPLLDVAAVDAQVAEAVPESVRLTGTREGAVHDRWTTDAAVLHAELTELLTRSDDGLLAGAIEGSASQQRLQRSLRRQVAEGRVVPVVHTSATTGAGIIEAVATLTRWLPATMVSPAVGPPEGEVFAVVGDGGDRRARLLLRSGELRLRQRIRVVGRAGVARRATVTAVRTFTGEPEPTLSLPRPGDLADVATRPPLVTGDRLVPGTPAPHRVGPHDDHEHPHDHEQLLERPGLELTVRPCDPDRRTELIRALGRLADRDPYLEVGGSPDEPTVSVFGEIQAEVLAERLAASGTPVRLGRPAVRYVERLLGEGDAVERIGQDHHLPATVGLHVQPGPAGSGTRLSRPTRLHGVIPRAFFDAITATVVGSAPSTHGPAGPHGWPLLDVAAELVEADYAPPVTSAGDFRQLTPLVLACAIARAGTEVLEPRLAVDVDLPATHLAGLLVAVARLGGSRRRTRPLRTPRSASRSRPARPTGCGATWRRSPAVRECCRAGRRGTSGWPAAHPPGRGHAPTRTTARAISPTCCRAAVRNPAEGTSVRSRTPHE